MHKLPSATITQIISLLQSGHTTKETHERTGVSYGSISKIRFQHCSDIPKALGGRPKHLSPTATHRAYQIVTTGKGANATQAAKAMSTALGTTVRPWTVRRALRGRGLVAVAKKKQAYLTPKNKKARMEFAECHLDWTVDD
jgi:transposase